MNLDSILSIALLALGFGFVIFWHELGHFLAAKWVGIRVEQFAVGFGQAILSWRKGVGVRVGNTQKEYDRRVQARLESKRAEQGQMGDMPEPSTVEYNAAARELGLGDTEYRLNWIPLGGYVKMLGQDDMNPNATSEDPGSYNRKSVGARMVVVSAGVIMNVILAGIGFMVLFLVGFNAPPAAVGAIAPGSPAQLAGMRPGDSILRFDDKPTEDFTKIHLNVALSGEGESVPVVVERMVDGQVKQVTLQVTPRRREGDARMMMELGIAQPRRLMGPGPKDKLIADEKDLAQLVPPEAYALKGGDVITRVGDQPITHTAGERPDLRQSLANYAVFDAALQQSFGRPVKLTVKNAAGQERVEEIRPHLDHPFVGQLNFAGMMLRPTVDQITLESPARGKLFPGDVITYVSTGADASGPAARNPTIEKLKELLNKAGSEDQPINLKVLRDGKPVEVNGLKAVKLDGGGGRRGLSVGLGIDDDHAVVAATIKGSPADKAGIPAGATITSVAGQPVASWHDVFKHLRAAPAGDVAVKYTTEAGEAKSATLALSPDQKEEIAANRYTHSLPLAELKIERQTDSPLVAAKWGTTETRDFILQFYLTLRRMVDGTVSPSNAMGPLGIFHAGTSIAERGYDWLLWFLAMISANLAVVNFLPIPIVDGGLFTFLILEKIKGRPLSARTQSIAQVVGLVLLLGVFLFVTYNDITRLF